MALNQFMHPRNPYREKKPDFKYLAEKYEEFREFTTTDAKGKVHVDFKNPACLRALTWALLKSDFELDIKMPLDRLIPTVPLRLNYILWLQDIFGSTTHSTLQGIDIGTGTSCIYPLLAARQFGWDFVATEADATNYEYAKENVVRNGLTDKIKVVRVTEDTSLIDVLPNDTDIYDFCMCNPPFYGSNLEAWGWLTTRQDSTCRCAPMSVSTASPVESITPGGEVQFVSKYIIDSSIQLKTRIRVYSTMLGKKSSVSTLKEILHMNKIYNIGVMEFCQGKTMRWGVAWTFDSQRSFPKPLSKAVKSQKQKKPLSWNFPTKFNDLRTIVTILETLFMDLKIVFSVIQLSLDNTCQRWQLKCPSNTWTHQRRKRRQIERHQQQQDSVDTAAGQSCGRGQTGRHSSSGCMQTVQDSGDGDSDREEIISSPENKKQCLNEDNHTTTTTTTRGESVTQTVRETSSDSKQTVTGPSVSVTAASDELLFILCCELTVHKVGDSSFVLEMNFIDGQNIELMHQLLQYFKNKLLTN